MLYVCLYLYGGTDYMAMHRGPKIYRVVGVGRSGNLGNGNGMLTLSRCEMTLSSRKT